MSDEQTFGFGEFCLGIFCGVIGVIILALFVGGDTFVSHETLNNVCKEHTDNEKAIYSNEDSTNNILVCSLPAFEIEKEVNKERIRTVYSLHQ